MNDEYLEILDGGLTEADIALISKVADVMVEDGVWESVTYRASEKFDLVDVYEPNAARPAYCIGRYYHGPYMIADYRSGLVSLGARLGDVLRRHASIRSRPLTA